MIKKKPPHTPLQTIRDYSLISCDHYWGWKIPKKVQSKYHCAFMVIKTNLIKILGKKNKSQRGLCTGLKYTVKNLPAMQETLV